MPPKTSCGHDFDTANTFQLCYPTEPQAPEKLSFKPEILLRPLILKEYPVTEYSA